MSGVTTRDSLGETPTGLLVKCKNCGAIIVPSKQNKKCFTCNNLFNFKEGFLRMNNKLLNLKSLIEESNSVDDMFQTEIEAVSTVLNHTFSEDNIEVASASFDDDKYELRIQLEPKLPNVNEEEMIMSLAEIFGVEPEDVTVNPSEIIIKSPFYAESLEVEVSEFEEGIIIDLGETYAFSKDLTLEDFDDAKVEVLPDTNEVRIVVRGGEKVVLKRKPKKKKKKISGKEKMARSKAMKKAWKKGKAGRLKKLQKSLKLRKRIT